jgi:purine nucleoside phosphorylase
MVGNSAMPAPALARFSGMELVGLSLHHKNCDNSARKEVSINVPNEIFIL